MIKCETVSDLNNIVNNGKIRQLIQVCESLHEREFVKIAEAIRSCNARIVMIAGPSASGKTTSANRLACQLRTLGKEPIIISLDDYYIDRDNIRPGPDGTLDLEHINTIDTKLFRSDMEKLQQGKVIQLPAFDFITGRRSWQNRDLEMQENTVVIVEGLHGLNPILIPEKIDNSRIFRLYIIPLLQVKLDENTPIPTSFLRRLRRIVRDYRTRGSSVQQTISMWESVRRGENRWIFPFQENADMVFNSATLYELAILKKHSEKLFAEVDPSDHCYEHVAEMLKILDGVEQADVDNEIPPTSIVREFIGNNTFYI